MRNVGDIVTIRYDLNSSMRVPFGVTYAMEELAGHQCIITAISTGGYYDEITDIRSMVPKYYLTCVDGSIGAERFMWSEEMLEQDNEDSILYDVSDLEDISTLFA